MITALALSMVYYGAAIAILVFCAFGLKLITDAEVGILTKRMFGRKMPSGRIVARDGEIGVQADILMPGLYWRIPIIWNISKVKITPDILISAAGGDQGATSLLSTWLAQTVSKGLQDGKKGEPDA